MGSTYTSEGDAPECNRIWGQIENARNHMYRQCGQILDIKNMDRESCTEQLCAYSDPCKRAIARVRQTLACNPTSNYDALFTMVATFDDLVLTACPADPPPSPAPAVLPSSPPVSLPPPPTPCPLGYEASGTGCVPNLSELGLSELGLGGVPAVPLTRVVANFTGETSARDPLSQALGSSHHHVHVDGKPEPESQDQRESPEEQARAPPPPDEPYAEHGLSRLAIAGAGISSIGGVGVLHKKRSQKQPTKTAVGLVPSSARGSEPRTCNPLPITGYTPPAV